MRPRHAVLLTPPKSCHPSQLLSRQYTVRVNPLEATLMCSPVNVASKRLTAWLSPLDATLTKNRGWGRSGAILRPPIFRTLFQVPYPVSLLFATLTKTPGMCTNNSHPGTLRAVSLTLSPIPNPPSPRCCYTVPPMARQRLGQHFLADLHWREEIARAIRVSSHSTVPLPRDDQHCWIEIGSGHGEMPQHLLATGAPVHAIEIDPAFLPGLRRLAKLFPNLTVVPGDILKADLAAIASGRRIRIYGNLPYYITSPILHYLFAFAGLIDEIHIVIQTEVALRFAAQPGTRDYGYLSVVTQSYSRPEFVFEIPRDAFNPPPEVASALVTLRLPGERAKLSLSSASDFLDFVKLCFSKKRKTLVNNLRTLAKPDRAREALASLTLRPDARAEQLSVSQLAALHSLLASA